MPFQPQIQPGDDRPIYRQIAQQVVDAVANGDLAPGGRLPSHRQLAEQLVVAPLTVKKAYDALEREGVVHTLRGQGTFVVDQPPEHPTDAARARLQTSARRLLAEAHAVGADLGAVLDLVRDEAARQAQARQEKP